MTARAFELAVWSPLPPSPSGIADYAAEQLPALARHVELHAVVPDPRAVDPSLAQRVPLRVPESSAADLDLYQIGNSPAHAYAYRAALARPGVVLLHDVSLHHLVLAETVERGDGAAYLREMRRSHGERGAFVGRQVARALGGDLLPALFPLNDRALEAPRAGCRAARCCTCPTTWRCRSNACPRAPRRARRSACRTTSCCWSRRDWPRRPSAWTWRPAASLACARASRGCA
jgi:hypothetical protein